MNRKVLVVDDDAETRMIVSDLLGQLDVSHTLVGSAGECISRLVSEPAEYSMVLMDIHMPNLSGADASVWIKDSEADILANVPIIAMTGDTTFWDDATLQQWGMQGVLPKPISIDQLVSTLDDHALSIRPS